MLVSVNEVYMSGAINQSLIPKYYMCYTMYKAGQSLYAEIYYSFSQTTLGFFGGLKQTSYSNCKSSHI